MSVEPNLLTQLLGRDIPRDYETRAILEEDAHAIASLAPHEYTQTTYLYFIARYLVVVYEISFGQIPIQVWNEYRNAFDHYIRHITKDSGDTTDHVKKIEGHIQRAVLDISKVFCHDTEDMLNSDVAVLHKPSLMLIDNGTFFYGIEARFENAKDNFIKAKVFDLTLGDDARHNSKIISMYLDAVYSYIDIQRTLRDRRKDISEAKIRHDAIKRESADEHVKLSLIAKFIWTGVVAICTLIFAYLLKLL